MSESSYPAGSASSPRPPDELPLDHIGIAVPSIEDALPTFERLAGAHASAIQTVDAQAVRVAFVGAGPTRIELLEPTRDDSPVARFLARRGPGLHHIAYRTDDIDAQLRRHAGAGFELIDTEARPGADGHRVAFLHPRTTGGVLVELVQHVG